LRGAGRCAGATGLDAGQPNGFVPDDDRVGRRVGASQQQGVGRMLGRDEQVDGLARSANRAHVDLALVDVALKDDLSGRVDRAGRWHRCRARLGGCRVGDRRAAVGRVNVAEDVRDGRAVDADTGRLFDRQDRLDGDAVAGFDELKRVRGRRANEQEYRWNQQRRRELAGQVAHTGSP